MRSSLISLLFGVYLILVGCNIDQKKTIDIDNPSFTSTDDSELFFKNLRQTYYDKIEMEQAKLNQYRLKDRIQDSSKPILQLCIVENWRYDEAYVLVEPNEILSEENLIEVKWVDPATNQDGIYSYSRGNKEIQFQFAARIYSSLQKEHKLQVKVKEQWVPFLANEDEKEAFRITLVDYYRLVNAIR